MRPHSRDASQQLKRDWCDSFIIEEQSDGKLMVVTPFVFPDGDGFPVVIERTRHGWRISDGGVAISHLQFSEYDLTEGRRRLVDRFAAAQGATVNRDELSLHVTEFPDTDDIAEFLKLIAQITGMPLHDVTERDSEQFRTRATRTIIDWLDEPSDAQRNWQAPPDQRGLFPADLHLPGDPVPVVAFFAGSSQKAERSMSYIGQYAKWHLDVKPVLAYTGRLGGETLYRAQEVLDDTEAVVQVDERLESTAYLGLSRVLRGAGVPISPR